MFKDSISGLDKMLETDIPAGSVILVTGMEGTLKSGLVFHMLSSYLSRSGQNGLYVTLEQTSESHLRNMLSLGLEKSDALHIFDYRDMRREWEDREPDLIEITKEIIDFYKEKENITVFALDSLSAFYSFSEKDSRVSMYHLFSKLRDEDLTSFMITEDGRTSYPDNSGRQERFLADGVIELGIIETPEDDIKRYIRIRKMRAAKHSMEKHQLLVGKSGLYILGSIY